MAYEICTGGRIGLRDEWAPTPLLCVRRAVSVEPKSPAFLAPSERNRHSEGLGLRSQTTATSIGVSRQVRVCLGRLSGLNLQDFESEVFLLGEISR